MAIKEKIKTLRGSVLDFVFKYWWIWIGITVIGYFFTDISIFRYLLYIVAIPIALLFFAPIIIQLVTSIFGPSLVSIFYLIEHFKEARDMPFDKKYIFIPTTLVASVAFLTAQGILSIWVSVATFVIWMSVIGAFFAFLLLFIFGLFPVAIFAAPFVILFTEGLSGFFAIVVFFLLALFWVGLSKLAFSEDYTTTPEDFLGYSPQLYLLGALSVQIIALPFYQLGLSFENNALLSAGDWIAGWGGAIFMLLALVAWFKWRGLKKKLSKEEKESLYRPSVWVYVFGFFVTSILYSAFLDMYSAPVFALFWLNTIFTVVIIVRIFSFIRGFFKQKLPKPNKQLE